ncbi:Pentatricopeptide repeat [Dillenia turbinata]|uniref:Pentatricopeptide repeat n=1 Tax=Dillenia turbinata TaxID=194707 RepID=A0AAN8YZG2_9MAGN
MLANQAPPNNHTFPSLIKASISSIFLASNIGRTLHSQVIRRGVSDDPFILTSLIALYAQFGNLVYARNVFDEITKPCLVSYNAMLDAYGKNGDMVSAVLLFDRMRERDVVSWTSIINGFGTNGCFHEAIGFFKKMMVHEDVKCGLVKPNEATYVTLLSACAGCEGGKGLDYGKQIHGYIVKNEEKLTIYVGTALISMYGKMGCLSSAMKVFDGMAVKGVCTWNAMISSLASNGREKEAFELFEEMMVEKMQPNEITFVTVLSASAEKWGLAAHLRSAMVPEMMVKTTTGRTTFSLEIAALINLKLAEEYTISSVRVILYLAYESCNWFPAVVSKTLGLSEDISGKFASQIFAPETTFFLVHMIALVKFNHLGRAMEAAQRVADCGYEYNTDWGKKVGWMYGSTSEDIMTRLGIHSKGLISTRCSPAFLGSAPSAGPASLSQQKRWISGLLEILFSKKSPVLRYIKGKLEFRMCLVYMGLMWIGIHSIPELCYAALPAFCLLTNSNFLPQARKVQKIPVLYRKILFNERKFLVKEKIKDEDPALLIPLALFVLYYLHTLSEYIHLGLSMREWWNNERMNRIKSATSWLFATLGVALKILGLSDSIFEITKKDSYGDSKDTHVGRFTFDESPLFDPVTTITLVHMIALVATFSGLQPPKECHAGSGLGEIICSIYAVLCSSPFAKRALWKRKIWIALIYHT